MTRWSWAVLVFELLLITIILILPQVIFLIQPSIAALRRSWQRHASRLSRHKRRLALT